MSFLKDSFPELVGFNPQVSEIPDPSPNDRCPIDQQSTEKALVDYSYRIQEEGMAIEISRQLPGYRCANINNCDATVQDLGLRGQFLERIIPGLGRLGFNEQKDELEKVLGKKTFPVAFSEQPTGPNVHRNAIMRDRKLVVLP